MPAAAAVVGRLQEQGYDAVAVTSVGEAFDALRSDRYGLAVTSRLNIDLVRNIRPIPVINFEIFFHADISSRGLTADAKRFDGKAFLDRVRILSKTPQTRAAPTAPSSPRYSVAPFVSRCRATLKGLVSWRLLPVKD
jgi:hypothetical protein